MKREINSGKITRIEKGRVTEVSASCDMRCEDSINTDPYGSWTGVSTEDMLDKPIQDADDL